MTEKVDEMKNSRKEELEQEYEKLVAGLKKARDMEDAGLGGPPVLPKDLLQSAIPGKGRTDFKKFKNEEKLRSLSQAQYEKRIISVGG